MTAPRIEDAHQKLQDAWPSLRQDYAATHTGLYLELSCVARTPDEQWMLYTRGRVPAIPGDGTGAWVIKDKALVVTNVDGYKVVGKHNKTPAEAIDVIVFSNVTGRAVWDKAFYQQLGPLASEYGLVWGGNWHSLADLDHLEVGG